MNSKSNLDPMMLQRLIDGELTTEQVQEILSQAQASPWQWETIAVGFVENQAWQRALSSTFDGQNSESNSSMGSVNVELGQNSAATSIRSKATTKAADPKRALSPWWVMAASLLAAAAIGYMASQIQNRTLPIDSIAVNDTNDEVSPETIDTPQLTAAALTPDFHVEVPEDSGFAAVGGQGFDNRIPVYRVTNADQLRQLRAQREIESAFPRSVIEQLSDSGYQIEQEVEFVSGQLDDRSFVVPLRTIRFIPGQ